MTNSLEGKVALVTGSARRLGAHTVQTLHNSGANVVIHYHSSAKDATQLAEKLNKIRENSAAIVQANLLDETSLIALIDQVIQNYGRLDILINNASSFYPTSIGKVTTNQWDDLMGTNLKAPFFLSQAAVPYLEETKGCIVNMVDIHAFRPLQDYPVYTIAKAGLLMMTKSLAKELGPKIRVNGVAPGIILWPEQDDLNENIEEPAKTKVMQDELLERTALKHQGSPEDIARAIMYLVESAPYVTGHVIPIDGGRLLNQ